MISRPASPTTPGAPPYVPSDIYKGYDYTPLYAHGVYGNGTRIAVIDAYSDPTLAQDLSSFDSVAGLPGGTFNTFYPDGPPRFRNSGWALETALDVEWAHAIAPQATIDLVVAFDSSLGHVYDGISYVANNLQSETVLTMSFGLPESQYPTSGSYTLQAHHQLISTIVSHGASVFSSSGDNGATSCCDPSYPASDPLVISVGGTTLNLDSAGTYSSETAWSSSGAGSSITFSKPSWQQGLGDSMRDSVDVSYNADPNTGFLVVQGGVEYIVGGTSAGSPQWAALTALASQYSGSRYGSIAAKLYHASGYHDITGGSDGFFQAATGWDYPTGLGSPNASLLVSLLQPPVLVRNSALFQGLNVTTSANLQVNIASLTVTGNATVTALNQTTNAIVYSNNYNLTNLAIRNQTMGQNSRFLLYIPVSPYPLTVGVTLTIHATTTTAHIIVTRRVNISGGDTVTIVDISITVKDYGQTQGMPNYNPLADLTGTGMIGIVDIAIANLYYGTHVYG